MSTEMIWTIIAGVLCICVAYGIGYQVGDRRAKKYLHRYYTQLINLANGRFTYKKGGKDTDAKF